MLAVSRVRVRHGGAVWKSASPARAVMLSKLLSHPERLLTSVILTNGAVNLLLLLLIATALVGVFDRAGYLIAFTVALPLFWLIELVPKSMGRYFPYRFLTLCTPVLQLLYHLPGLLFAGFGTASKRPSSSQRAGEREEFRHLTHVIEDEGTLTPKARTMIDGILDLQNVTAQDVMQPIQDVVAITSETPIANALGVLREAGYEAVPLQEANGDVRVIVRLKDLVRSANQAPARDVARPAPIFDLSERGPAILRFLRMRGAPLGLVRDASARVVGVIYLEEVLGRLLPVNEP